MKNHTAAGRDRLYLGVDVAAPRCRPRWSGIGRDRRAGATAHAANRGPQAGAGRDRKGHGRRARKGKTATADLTAIGVAVPGVVDPETARVVVTPNMSLTGRGARGAPGGPLPRAGGRGQRRQPGDVGRAWLGSARQAAQCHWDPGGHGNRRGIVPQGEVVAGGPRVGRRDRAHRHADRRAEVRLRQPRLPGGPGQPHGHRARHPPGPGRRPQQRWPSLAGGDLSVIRSGAIRKALEAEDPLVSEVVRHASEVLGYACLTVRHLIDPEVIVLGGGVVEACSDFMMPIVENIVGSDRLPGARDGGQVLLSALGDDAVVLGAVALARKLAGRSPFKKRYAVQPTYPEIRRPASARSPSVARPIAATSTSPSTARSRARDKVAGREAATASARHRAEGVGEVCKGGPEVLFVGAGNEGRAT